ncbi:pyridoxal 5'-phosphate synthase [Kitasatospora nipponensis]|uniref:Pyridoxal 5'-phosphate synthase n=1 Tax=Kitasatospora nipponensis TaxID=258049 RepID=A0ABN1WFG1_9ACTN
MVSASHSSPAQHEPRRPSKLSPEAELHALLLERPAMARELPSFDPAGAPDRPGDLFVAWLVAAMRAGVPDAQVVTLSTVAAVGGPDARVVALREVEAAAGVWWFAGDARSPKGRQLAAVPRAALTFYWPELGRQVRVRGRVAVGAPERAAAVFQLLSPRTRTAALVGRQSEPMGAAADFGQAWGSARAALAADGAIVADGYTQYAVHAEEVEFWQGDADRAHVRLLYRRAAERSAEAPVWERGLRWP